ncbi:helix-turn-helix transcriptional regulator [Kitasatospora sp. NPDC004669]|uniref:helix-turn-helix domain-containing protein n=1 Tax=Kitasatospora sp. NPDC004669 TaxID=3154555 RepID=UPI0033A64A44
MDSTFSADALIAVAIRHGDNDGAAISKRTGVSQSTVSRLLAGHTVPSLTTLVALRAAYRLSLDAMVPAEQAA